MGLRMQGLYTWPWDWYQRLGDVSTGSSSLTCTWWFSHEYSDSQFTVSSSGKHVIHEAEEGYHLQLIRSNPNFTLSIGGQFPCNRHTYNHDLVSVVGVCSFLMYPEFAAIVVDAVVAFSCTTNSAWVLT